MLFPQYQVLVLKLSQIYTVSLNTVFSIPQNHCYPGTPCNLTLKLVNTRTFSTFLAKTHRGCCCMKAKYQKKTRNLQCNTLGRWVAGTNNSATKHLMFQVYYLFFKISCKILCKNCFNLLSYFFITLQK